MEIIWVLWFIEVHHATEYGLYGRLKQTARARGWKIPRTCDHGVCRVCRCTSCKNYLLLTISVFVAN